MAAVFAFIGIWLVSLVTALLAALQLGDYFRANDEFPLIIAAIVLLCTASMAIFAAAYALARAAAVLQAAAIVLAVLAFAPAALPGLVQSIADHSTNPGTVGIENTYITIELIVPTLVAILVQWGLMRRRWLRATGADDLTLWPWVTTVIGALVVLNPLGLAILGSALRRSKADWLLQLWLTVSVVAALVLVVMALIECYIRRRIMRRRLAPPAAPSPIQAHGEASG